MNKTPTCIVLLLLFIAVVVFFLACDENDSEDGVTGDEEYPGDSLKIQPPGIGIYLGAYDWMENGEKPGIEEFETAVGKKVALTGGGVCISAENQPFSIDVSCLQTKYDNGYTILTDISLRESDKIYLPQEIIDGQADHLLEDLADNLIAAGVPLFLAYPREPKVQPQWGFDGGGYGEDGDKLNTEVNDLYGAYGCADQQDPMCLDGPERYRDLCKYIHEAIEAKAPSRATWVMGAVIDRTPGWYEQVYPGNEYVDWHALDVYAWTESPTTIVSFSESVSPTWSEALSLDDKPIVTTKAARLWRYHKAAGLVVTHKDPQGRPTVFDHLPKNMPRIVSVGRLDMDTEGLLLLTNDGELSRQLELPATGWARKYRVRVHGQPDQKKLDMLKNGIEIDGIRYGPIDAKIERIQTRDAWLSFALSEGKNREIRRVCQHLRLHITRLIRTSYGPFNLGDLAKDKVEEVPAKVMARHIGT